MARFKEIDDEKKLEIGIRVIDNKENPIQVARDVGVHKATVDKYALEYAEKHDLDYIVLGKETKSNFPLELLCEWERVRFMLNPNAKKRSSL